MFGVAPVVGMGVEPGVAVVWLLASDGLYEIKRDFLRQCVGWLDHLQRHYPLGINYVHTANKAAIEWCKHVGFELGPVQVYGQAGENFMQLTRRA
jgi:hypothetical protein